MSDLMITEADVELVPPQARRLGGHAQRQRAGHPGHGGHPSLPRAGNEVEGFDGSVHFGSQAAGAGAGKVSFNPFSITRKIDQASPVVLPDGDLPAPVEQFVGVPVVVHDVGEI